MIGPTGAVRVMVATKPVDFRKGADGRAALVREAMGSDPFSGAVYVFRAKRAGRVNRMTRRAFGGVQSFQPYRSAFNHSSSFVQRLRPAPLLTAIANARRWPTMTTSRFPRVTAV